MFNGEKKTINALLTILNNWCLILNDLFIFNFRRQNNVTVLKRRKSILAKIVMTGKIIEQL